MRSPPSRPWIPLVAALLLAGCGYGGGTDVCFWDAYGSYACGGYYDDPYYDDPWYPYDPWYKPEGLDPCAWLRWQGNENDFLVLDATDDVVRFAAEAPHVLIVGPTRVPNVEVTYDGVLWHEGAAIGRIALVPSPAGGDVAALVDAHGRHLDLRLEDDALVLQGTAIPALDAGTAAADGAACDARPAPRRRLALLEAPADGSAWARLLPGESPLTVVDAR